MATLKDVSRHVRSKNAGPFWVTTDIFFGSTENFVKYAQSPKLCADVIAGLYDVDPALVRHYPIADINVLKISWPRTWDQGGEIERDMHCGNQCKRMLAVEVD